MHVAYMVLACGAYVVCACVVSAAVGKLNVYVVPGAPLLADA